MFETWELSHGPRAEDEASSGLVKVLVVEENLAEVREWLLRYCFHEMGLWYFLLWLSLIFYFLVR